MLDADTVDDRRQLAAGFGDAERWRGRHPLNVREMPYMYKQYSNGTFRRPVADRFAESPPAEP